MDEASQARAYSRGYQLLGAFSAQGLTSQMLELLRQVGALAELLPHLYDAEGAAAAHYRVFGQSVPAWQSAFLSADGRRGGDEAERVQIACAHIGFAPPAALDADSLACELAALAHLCAAEADAWEDGKQSPARQARVLQATFLGDHLLRWLPPLCEALQRQPPLYAAVGALLRDVVADHASALAAFMPLPQPATVAAPPDVGASETNLGAIVGWLLAPASAGFLLMHEELQQMAASASLPAGFGDRRTTLTQLLRAAGEYDALPLLLDALEVRTAAAAAAYAAMAAASDSLAPWVQGWAARTVVTLGLLNAMREQAKPAV